MCFQLDNQGVTCSGTPFPHRQQLGETPGSWVLSSGRLGNSLSPKLFSLLWHGEDSLDSCRVTVGPDVISVKCPAGGWVLENES